MGVDLSTTQGNERHKHTKPSIISTVYDHSHFHCTRNIVESIMPGSIFYFFFFCFFFFTPPPADAVGIVDVVGTVGTGVERPVSTGERISATEAGIDASFRRCWFCIFCMRDKFRDSNRLRKIDEFVLNLRHFWENGWGCNTSEFDFGLTVVLSVIFKTNFPSDDFHFTQYRA